MGAGPLTNGNVVMGNANTFDNKPFARDETAMPVTYTRLEGSIRHTGSIPTLRELVCISLNLDTIAFSICSSFDICP